MHHIATTMHTMAQTTTVAVMRPMTRGSTAVKSDTHNTNSLSFSDKDYDGANVNYWKQLAQITKQVHSKFEHDLMRETLRTHTTAVTITIILIGRSLLSMCAVTD